MEPSTVHRLCLRKQPQSQKAKQNSKGDLVWPDCWAGWCLVSSLQPPFTDSPSASPHSLTLLHLFPIFPKKSCSVLSSMNKCCADLIGDRVEAKVKQDGWGWAEQHSEGGTGDKQSEAWSQGAGADSQGSCTRLRVQGCDMVQHNSGADMRNQSEPSRPWSQK